MQGQIEPGIRKVGETQKIILREGAFSVHL